MQKCSHAYVGHDTYVLGLGTAYHFYAPSSGIVGAAGKEDCLHVQSAVREIEVIDFCRHDQP